MMKEEDKGLILSPLDENGNPDVNYKERDPAKAGTVHTLYKLGKKDGEISHDLIPDEIAKEVEGEGGRKYRAIDYDLDNPDPEKRKKIDEAMEARFNELTKELWDLLVTHGYAKEQANGEYILTKEISDLDGESCLELCRLAGLDTAKIKYVPQEQGEDEEGLVMDTSRKRDGTVALFGGRTAVIDHHGDESDRYTSATKYVYNFLIENGILKKEAYLDQYIEFVTQHDNYYPELTEAEFRNSYRTLRGLSHCMAPADVIKLFREAASDGKVFNPDESFTSDYLQTHIATMPGNEFGKSLEVISNNSRKYYIEKSFKEIEILEKKGFVFDTGDNNFGKVFVDPGRKDQKNKDKCHPRVQAGYEAARFCGYGGYLRWSPQTNSFVLFTDKSLKDIGLSQGFNMRGHMWMKPKNRDLLKITLEEIVSKLSGTRTKIPAELRKALGGEKLETLIDLPEGSELPDVDKSEKKKEVKEVTPEKWEWIQLSIKNFVKGGQDWLNLLKEGKLFTAPSNKEEEKREVEKYLRKCLGDYSERFDDDEKEYIIEQSMQKIFS